MNARKLIAKIEYLAGSIKNQSEVSAHAFNLWADTEELTNAHDILQELQYAIQDEVEGLNDDE